VVAGGTPIDNEAEKLSEGVDIMIGTPHRVGDHF